eukprot:scaffold598_cov235-Prasinococcus_capsulatus_cf.AAC.3
MRLPRKTYCPYPSPGSCPRPICPGRYVLVERGCIVKHSRHIRHLARVPGRYVLVERVCIPKHVPHIPHLARVPGRYVLVERVCICKHVGHPPHLARVPARYVLVERVCIEKHAGHPPHLARVPARYVLVERVCTRKHVQHIRHLARVPRGDRKVSGCPAVHREVSTVACARAVCCEAVIHGLTQGLATREWSRLDRPCGHQEECPARNSDQCQPVGHARGLPKPTKTWWARPGRSPSLQHHQ